MELLLFLIFYISCTQKNISRNFAKPIDNHMTVWYNLIKNKERR